MKILFVLLLAFALTGDNCGKAGSISDMTVTAAKRECDSSPDCTKPVDETNYTGRRAVSVENDRRGNHRVGTLRRLNDGRYELSYSATEKEVLPPDSFILQAKTANERRAK